MKTLMRSLGLALFVLSLFGSGIVLAKVTGLNEMIHEGALNQKQLHRQMKKQNGWKAPKVESKPEQIVLETTVSDYTPKTSQRLLTYKKEQAKPRISPKKQGERVADELDAAGETNF